MLPVHLWQLLDAAFPTGAFAHSGGLEAAVQGGERGDIASQVRALWEASAWLQGPLAVAAFREPLRWKEIDHEAETLISCPPARRASTALGRGLCTTLAKSIATPVLKEIRAQVLAGQYGHAAPLWGVCLKQLGCAEADMLDGLLFTVLRDLISAAVRLGQMGPYAAQSVQWQFSERLPELRAAVQAEAQVWQTDPIGELWAGQHERLHSRLFHT